MAPPDKKRKKEKEDKKATPAKKRKLDTKSKDAGKKSKTPTSKTVGKAKAGGNPAAKKATATKKTAVKKTAAKKSAKTASSTKKVAATKVKKALASKVKKVDPKGKGAKGNSSKKPVKVKEVKKVNKANKGTSGKAKPVKETKNKGKNAIGSKASKKMAAKSVTRSKIEKTVSKSKVQVTASKAKAKALKNLTKPKASVAAAKKPKQLPSKQKVQKEKVAAKAKNNKAKATKTDKNPKQLIKPAKVKGSNPKSTNEAKSTKNVTKTNLTSKNVKENPSKSAAESRKRKNPEPETPDKNAEDSRKRRIITPNKKYADFEVSTPSKNVSELRAFLQDKKKETKVSTSKSVSDQKTSLKEKEKKTSTEEKTGPTSLESLKVIKPSEMKPADKLLKKLQKKLEKEAKAASVLKSKSDKPKVSKLVTYHKPAAMKAKPPPPLMQKAKAALKMQQVKQVKKVKQNASMPPKASPKVAQSPEKAKPKKIKELKKEDRLIQAQFVHQKYIREWGDTSQDCWVTGIEVFPSGEVVVVDMANKKIKLYTEAFALLNQIKLDTIPQDISVSPIDASSAYFTKPFSKEGIQKISMCDGTISLKESFWTNGTNRGINCTKAGILTSVQDGRYHDLDINCFKIDLLDYEGRVLQSVSTDQGGVRLFKLPLYFTVNSTGKQIIVSDCIRNNSYIVSFDMSGKIKFKYTGGKVPYITPRGLTIDKDDNIYVTEWDNHNVYVLSPTGKRLQVLIDDKELKEEGQDGLQKPYQLCYHRSEKGDRLFVSQERCNTIKVFNIVKKGAEGGQGKVEEQAADDKQKDADAAASAEKAEQS